VKLIYDGVTVEFGSMMFHSRDERLHQRTTAPTQ
jgi:hypothetical protein